MVSNYTQSRELELSVEATDSSQLVTGNHTIVVVEVDWFSGFTTEHQVSVIVLAPFVFPGF